MKKISSDCGCAEIRVHSLINGISRKFFDAYTQRCDESGIPHGYRQLLFHLGQKDGVTQLCLARLTALKPPTVSIALRKMESDGIVRRESDRDDLRRTLVYLTERGREITEKIMESFHKYDKLITDALTENELETLCVLLSKINDIVSSISDGVPENCEVEGVSL